jgi:diadenosine tetraphosphatase ApaH/serine/threonine PP2A family protein phosphatase
MTYLAGLHVIGETGLFYADRLGASVFPIGERDRKPGSFPLHYRGAAGRLRVFLTLPLQNLTLSCHVTYHSPLLPGKQYQLFSVDPGQINQTV